MFQVFQCTPAGNGWDIESFVVFVFIIRQFAGLVFGLAFVHVVTDHRFLCLIKRIRKALQEHHSEDVVLVLRCVHITAKNVGCFPEEGFKLLKIDVVAHKQASCTTLFMMISNYLKSMAHSATGVW